jgi:aminopeptidase N
MTHAYFQSPREWLNEGMANFIGTLWVERVKGRESALEHLEASRGALAVGEPASPGESTGQSLIDAADAVYYRGKATYVLWMLRDLVGDKALAAALRAYDPTQDTAPEYFEHLLEKASGKDLKWFFDDWVYHDKGLPDLSISGIYPTASSQAGQYLVAIDLANDGYAGAEVPVTVRSQATTQTVRVLIPARSKVSRRLLIQGLPTEVIVNDGVVPELQASIHRRDITMTNNSK